MPRSLYGRAALILILPVLTVQLVVSVTFIQRHFEDVTRQLTQGLGLDVVYISSQLPDEDPEVVIQSGRALSRQFGLQFSVVDTAATGPLPARRRFYDFSGSVVIDVLQEVVPNLLSVDLPDDKRVAVYVELPAGTGMFSFDRTKVSASNPHQLLVWTLVAGAFMTLIAYSFLRNQLRPIKRMAAAAEAFGKGRHVPYKPGGAIEVRAAGNAFLEMRARIERQIEQRTLMLSGVSHDLRTPLTRLKLGLSMIDDDSREDLENDVTEMQHLLDEFLSFAKGDSEGEPELIDPIQLAQDIVSGYERSGMPVSLGEVEGTGPARLRPVAVRRAVENLIGNGVRYGTEARLSVRVGERSVRFRIEDNGPGIPPDQRGEAVKPFSRLDPSRNQNKGSGVGLGLAIVTDIARAHGGSLRLDQSDDLGGLMADLVLPR
ncbi:two-component sensor histidine kinase [Donghicola sp. B5-SW-15]|uniref:histidine kinase n=2 Tax=Donghicola mangrovi TaxID=2729614 RepID=A0A850Q9X6_9RHOB|nr:two-component sensor histidine kinase [Donghicola mangrovi]